MNRRAGIFNCLVSCVRPTPILMVILLIATGCSKHDTSGSFDAVAICAALDNASANDSWPGISEAIDTIARSPNCKRTIRAVFHDWARKRRGAKYDDVIHDHLIPWCWTYGEDKLAYQGLVERLAVDSLPLHSFRRRFMLFPEQLDSEAPRIRRYLSAARRDLHSTEKRAYTLIWFAAMLDRPELVHDNLWSRTIRDGSTFWGNSTTSHRIWNGTRAHAYLG